MDNSFHFFQTIICTHCGHEIKVPVYCGNRFCPVCSVPRLARVKRRLKFLVKNSVLPRGTGFKHLTLTIRNQSDLPQMLRNIVRSFRKLRQRAGWKNRVLGGSFVLEVTGNPGSWHAHIHTIIIAYYFPFDHLLKLWKAVSSGQGVYIQKLPPKQVIHYLAKYLTKPDVPDLVLDEVASELKGYRLFQPFGCWFKLMKEYKDKKRGCPECDSHEWLPSDIWFRALYNDRLPLRCYDLRTTGALRLKSA